MAADARRLFARVVGSVSRRLAGLEFDDLMALGCGVVTELEPRRDAVALTFDDGPSSHSTLRVLDLLDRHEAKGTFFLLGANARRLPDVVRAIARRGHA